MFVCVSVEYRFQVILERIFIIVTVETVSRIYLACIIVCAQVFLLFSLHHRQFALPNAAISVSY